MDIIPVLPLSQGEIDDVHETFVARLLDGAGIEIVPSQASTTRDEYAQRSTSGGVAATNAVIRLSVTATV